MKYSLSILLFLILNFQIKSQSLESDARNNFNDKNYIIALEQYLKLQKKDKYNDLFNYRIGLCYLYSNTDKSLAVPYLEFCDSIKYAKESIDYDLGEAYFYSYKFDKAVERFNSFIQRSSTNNELIPYARRYLEMCANARDLMKNPVNVTFINPGENINSKRSDFNPFVTENEDVMIFSSNRKYMSDFQTLINSIYITAKDTGSWSKPKVISNLSVNEGGMCVGFSGNGNNILINDNSLYLSKKIKNKYSPMVELDKLYNKFKLSGACINSGEDTIYFSCYKSGGLGGFDIYYSVRKASGDWGNPVNLGPEINTPYDEDFPNISSDGKTLYFCSTGYNSMGGFDLFKSTRTGDNNWSKPQNLGYPVNDVYDNKTISFTKSGRFAYVSAPSRKDGLGDWDIYKIVFNDIPPVAVTYSGAFGTGDSVDFEPVSKTDTSITAIVFLKGNKDSVQKLKIDYISNKYSVSLLPGDYILEVDSKSCAPYHDEIIIKDEEHKITTVNYNIYLTKLKSSKKN